MTTETTSICLTCGGPSATDTCPTCAEEVKIIGFELGLAELFRTDALLHDGLALCAYCGRLVQPDGQYILLDSKVFHRDCATAFGIWVPGRGEGE